MLVIVGGDAINYSNILNKISAVVLSEMSEHSPLSRSVECVRGNCY